MAGRVRVQPVSRVALGPLVEMAEHLRAALPGWEDTTPATGRQRVAGDLPSDLGHLARHDGDGFLTASMGDEVVGFAVAYVRSRQLTLAPLWFLPEHEAEHVADVLFRRLLAFGERSGAHETVAHLVGGAGQHALAFRFGLRPRFPVYRLALPVEKARLVGQELAKFFPGGELTQEVLQRRTGAADLERLDRLARGVSRPMDHEFWLAERHLRLATVREGQRVGAYAYGGRGQCGPVAGSTTESALAGLGWALQFAAEGASEWVTLHVPAPFEAAVEHLLEAGAVCRAVGHWLSRQPTSGLERSVFGSPTLV